MEATVEQAAHINGREYERTRIVEYLRRIQANHFELSEEFAKVGDYHSADVHKCQHGAYFGIIDSVKRGV